MYHKDWWTNNRWRWRIRFSHGNVKLIEYSSNYSETTGSLWFYSKGEATNFNADVVDNNNFKSFTYKAKLLETTVAQVASNEANEIPKNATIAFPLKYLSSFWRSLKIPSINYKVEIKPKWTKYCVLSAIGNDNYNDNNVRLYSPWF